jgi:FdrA protein
MTDRIVVRRNTYYDSITLMLASRDAESHDGVSFAAAVTATPVNCRLLVDQGFDVDPELGPNDLIVAIRADNDDSAEAAARAVEQRLSGGDAGGGRAEEPAPRSLRSAAHADADINVAFVSVPGRFSAYEVATALQEGLHVFCFSDGMAIEDEAALKRRAVERGLLFMGADCGTAIIDGVSFGFANAVKSGPVGIVGASGTGIQQVTCLLHAAGVGISHAIGVGGRDLSAEVAGTMTLHALDLLAKDDATEVIAVISKPPDPEVARRVEDRAQSFDKAVVLGFLGRSGTLENTAAQCAELSGGRLTVTDPPLPQPATAGTIRGFFCGGTLCEEAASIVRPHVPDAQFVDYGDDEYTEGRAHPMIDPALRNERFGRDSQDPSVGAILLDVVLGYGAHADPAAELAQTVERVIRRRDGRLSVVIALCGTDADPQNLSAQEDALRNAGAIVTYSAAHAARVALAATGRAP